MIDDYRFAKMVADDVKNQISREQREFLLEKENWLRWKEALLSLLENLGEQIEDIDLDEEADKQRFEDLGREGKVLMAEASRVYAERKKKISRFKFYVDKKLDQVVKMIDTGTRMESPSAPSEADTLRRAIIKHRAMLREYDLEDTAIDRALWATLENKWLFDSIDASTI